MKRFLSRVRGIAARTRHERELAEELEGHFQLHVDDNLRAGMAREEAVRQARLKFGGLEAAKENYRDTMGFPLLETIAQDVRFGFRLLRKSPFWSVVVGGTLALGIGLTTAIFSIVYSVLLQPLPYPQPDRLVALWTTSKNPGLLSRFNVIGANWKDWREQAKLFEDIALVRNVANFNLTGDGPPERLQGARTSANLTAVLGVKPLLGRTFTEEEVGYDARVAVLSYAFWQRRFAGDPGIIGRKLQMNGAGFEVIGVMPREYRYPTRDFELWTPLLVPADEMSERSQGNYSAVGRLKAGVTIAQGQREISDIMARLAQEYPKENATFGGLVEPLLESNVRDAKAGLYLLLGASACLLLIGCLNLSVLFIGRASVRQREMSVRAAIGAGVGRIRRQILAEALPLAATGTAGGVALAYALLQVAAAWLPASLPRAESIGMHLPVLLFSIGASLVTVFAAALLPSRIASRAALSRESRGSSSRNGVRNLLVAAQVAGATVLLFCGGLLARSLLEAARVNPGFTTRGVLTLHLAVTRARYPAYPQVVEYYRRILERIQSIPGVETAGFVNRLPLSGLNQTGAFQVEGTTDGTISTDTRSITPGYFEALQIPLLAGRKFSAADGETSPRVAIVDDAFARKAFQGRDPVGKRIRMDFDATALPWIEIAGVVGHIRNDTPEADSRPQIYLPVTQRGQDRGALVVRTQGDPAAFTAAVIAQIRAEDPEQPVYDVRTMREWMDRALESRMLLTRVVSLFSGAAVLLACLGVFGMVAYTANLRSREFGIRMALGASPGRIGAGVLLYAGKLMLAGIVVGAGLVWLMSRAIESLLFGVTVTDLSIWLVVPTLLVLVGLVAALTPAWRSARIDPMNALRSE